MGTICEVTVMAFYLAHYGDVQVYLYKFDKTLLYMQNQTDNLTLIILLKKFKQ